MAGQCNVVERRKHIDKMGQTKKIIHNQHHCFAIAFGLDGALRLHHVLGFEAALELDAFLGSHCAMGLDFSLSLDSAIQLDGAMGLDGVLGADIAMGLDCVEIRLCFEVQQ